MDDYNYSVKMVTNPVRGHDTKFYTHEGAEIQGVRKARYEVNSRGMPILTLEIVKASVETHTED